jgi:hypothetical protein
MKRRLTKKQKRIDSKFWLIHASHWLGAFVFIFVAVAIVYVFFANDPVVAAALG